MAKRAQPILTTVDASRLAHDPVNHPPYFNQGDIECIDAIRSMLGRDGFIAFLRGQVVKYQWRLLAKDNPEQDSRKATWYSDKLTEVLAEGMDT